MKLKQDDSLGPNLQKLRKTAGLTQTQVAAQLQVRGLDVSREMYAQMEAGTYNIRVSILKALKEIYRLDSYDAFFPGDLTMKCKQDLSIGPNLKRLRKAAGLTQAQAAAQLEVRGLPISAEILAKMEQGKYSIRISALKALKEIYRLDSYDDFFQGI